MDGCLRILSRKLTLHLKLDNQIIVSTTVVLLGFTVY